MVLNVFGSGRRGFEDGLHLYHLFEYNVQTLHVSAFSILFDNWYLTFS